MQITDVKIRRLFIGRGALKALVSVTLDWQLAIHEIKIVYANDRYFVVMPSKTLGKGEHINYVHPINSQFRNQLEETIIAEYRRALDSSMQNTGTGD